MKIKSCFKLLVLITLFFNSFEINADTSVSGNISTNTTWTKANSPYLVTGQIFILGSGTLTIEPGVKIKFTTGTSITVNGKLIARGLTNDMIIFTSSQNNPQPSDWKNIYFSSVATDATYDVNGNYLNGCILEYCIVEYAGGVSAEGAIRVESCSPYFHNCIVRNNGTRAFYLNGSTIKYSYARVIGCTITNNKYEGNGGAIYLNCGVYIIKNNIFAKNTANEAGAIYMNHFDQVLVNNNVFANNKASYSGAIYSDYWGGGYMGTRVTMQNNIFLDNTSNTNAGAVFMETKEIDIEKNVFVANKGLVCGAIRMDAQNPGPDDTNYVRSNGFYNNIANIQEASTMFITLSKISITHNNFSNNYTTYNFYNNTPIANAPEIYALNNFWGSSIDTIIEKSIFDFNDNSDYGLVNINNYKLLPDTSAPISPPMAVCKRIVNDTLLITWNKNNEPDLAGYNLYYGSSNGYLFSDRINLLTDTVCKLPGLSIFDTIAVTAYDHNAVGSNDQIKGYESWFSYAQEFFSLDLISSHNLCTYETINVKVTVNGTLQQGNRFTLQMSDSLDNFNNPIVLSYLDTNKDCYLIASIPDNILYNKKYLLRVVSSMPAIEVTNKDMFVYIYRKPTAAFEISKQTVCGSNTVTLTYTGNASSNANYNWNTDGAIAVPTSGQGPISAKWLTEGYKTISLQVSENGCFSELKQHSIYVQHPYNDLKICLVTVDTTTEKNLIIWERPNRNDISYFKIYKQQGLKFDSIGYVNVDSMTVFTDYTSAPKVKAERYKISVVDTCGNESPKSPYHQTINLGVSLGGVASTMVLTYNLYADESNVFQPAYHYIYRGTLYNKLTLHDSLSSFSSLFNDQNVYEAYYYRVGIKKTPACFPSSKTKIQSGPYSQSMSNIDDNKMVVKNNELNNNYRALVFPNPFNQYTTIVFPNPENDVYSLTIVDITGKVVYAQYNIKSESIIVNRSQFEAGYYSFELIGKRIFRGILIAE